MLYTGEASFAVKNRKGQVKLQNRKSSNIHDIFSSRFGRDCRNSVCKLEISDSLYLPNPTIFHNFSPWKMISAGSILFIELIIISVSPSLQGSPPAQSRACVVRQLTRAHYLVPSLWIPPLCKCDEPPKCPVNEGTAGDHSIRCWYVGQPTRSQTMGYTYPQIDRASPPFAHTGLAAQPIERSWRSVFLPPSAASAMLRWMLAIKSSQAMQLVCGKVRFKLRESLNAKSEKLASSKQVHALRE